MTTAIEVVVVAKDEATRVLQVVQRQLEIFPEFARTATVLGSSVDRTNRSLEGLELSTSKAARGIRSLVAPIVSELSPALGHTASQLASVVTTAAVLGTGFGAVAIAGAALAGILGGKLLQSWQESTAAAEAYQRAVRVGDLQAISTAISRQADEVLKLGRAHREAEAEAARARATLMMTGTVTAFDASRGVGWIVGPDDVTYFLLAVEIETPPLGAGDPVEFRAERVLATGPRATAVRRIPPPPAPGS